MFKDDRLWTLYKYWRDYKPEEELYARLKDNPCWPFKQIGDGYFYVVVRSDRVSYGIWILFFTTVSFSLILFILGLFPLAVGLFILFYGFGYWTIHGKMAWRELIISRRGKGNYMLRIFQNEEILFKNGIRNVYIRLMKKIDALGDSYFYLVLGGFELDDHRITRLTKAEGPLRIMGTRIAYRVGLNFFDWKDESEEHLVWHYKTYSKLKFKSHAEVIYKKPSAGETSPESSVSYFSMHRGSQLQAGNFKEKQDEMDAQESFEESADDDLGQKRKVRINKKVKVRKL